MLKDKVLFSPSKYKRNEKITPITKKIKIKKISCVICSTYGKSKNPKISHIFEEKQCENEDEKIFKEEESTEILKILDLIRSI